MPQRQMKAVYRGKNTVSYADPANLTNTLDITFTNQPKNAGDVKVTNARTELHALLKNVKVSDPDCTDPCKMSARTETLSGRLIISGSIENHDAVTQLLKDLVYNANSAIKDTGKGFPPGDDIVIDLGTA